MRQTKQEIGRQIKARRLALGMTCLELAAQTGMSQNTIYRIESGRSIPHATTLRELCRVLKMKM